MIKGSIDKLVIDGNRAWVSDYKTGKVANLRTKSKLSSTYKPGNIPADYWLQVGIYVLMVNGNKELGLFCDKGSIESLSQNESGNFETIDIYYNTQHVEIIKEMIRNAHARLQERDFLSGCGKDACTWCQFTKQQGWVRYLPTGE